MFIGRHIYRPIDTSATLFFMDAKTKALRAELRKLQKELGSIGLISHGYAQDRGKGAGHPNYQWSRKENKKTVSVAMSPEQFLAMKEAIESWRHAQAILKRKQQISREIIFKTMPDTKRRKPLSDTVLGLN